MWPPLSPLTQLIVAPFTNRQGSPVPPPHTHTHREPIVGWTLRFSASNSLQPLEASTSLIPDHSATYELYDRVVNVREGFSVPLGMRGTVIGISPGTQRSRRQNLRRLSCEEEFPSFLTFTQTASPFTSCSGRPTLLPPRQFIH